MTQRRLDKLAEIVNEIRKRNDTLRMTYGDGGFGSGNHGHAGRPGKRGGSAKGEGGVSAKTGAKYGIVSPGVVHTGKSGNFKPKNEGAKHIDTHDAVEEGKKMKGGNSLTKYVDANGNLSPQRQRIHDRIISNFFKDKVAYSGKPSLIMSGGGPASGKTFVRTTAEGNFGVDTTVTIDPDKVKEMLPGYKKMAVRTKKAAGYYHEESSALAKRMYQYAADNGLNVVYDGTGDGSVNSVMSKIKVAQDAGYKVDASYVTVEVDEALVRNKNRYESALKKWKAGESDIPPRLPEPGIVRKTHAKVSDISIQVANKFDSFVLYDNNVPLGEKPIKIATCKKYGRITAVSGQEDKLQRYLNKGSSGAKVINGQVWMPGEDPTSKKTSKSV